MLAEEIQIFRKSAKHLSSALTMSNICDFLNTSAFKNEFEKCGLIIFCHFLERVVPIGLFVSIIIRIQIGVISTITIASRIIHPNVAS